LKKINLFITGLGNVGSELLSLIHNNDHDKKTNIKVLGISNSKNMCFDPNGIDLSNWKNLLLCGKKNNREEFFKKIINYKIKNCVFVDNTASETISNEYINYLNKGVSVVTCNKIASSSILENYNKLKNISKINNVSFLYETNVGSSLPVIETLNNLILSGDKVISIKAILSGSLNYIFNNFKDENTFHNVIDKAKKLGLTEPNPKTDLSGIDVARKLLIISRESGFQSEINAIKIKSFLPQNKYLDTNSYNNFYNYIKENNNHFNKKLLSARRNNTRLKHIAELFSNGKGLISLKEVEKSDEFYNVNDEDNIILIYTKNNKSPILIKGPGAGGKVTAKGVLNDIIKV
jgi:aspartokinase/homoserine dehydrogenase 1